MGEHKPMESFTGDGVFWREGDDEQLAGTLTYTDEEGVRLDLLGAFGGVEAMQPQDEVPRILGVAGNTVVTLLDPIQSNFQMNAPGILRQSFRARVLLADAHLTEADLSFSSVLVRVNNLPAWVARSAVTVEMAVPEDGVPNFVKYTLTPLESDRAPIAGGGEIEVGFSWTAGGDHRSESYFKQDTYIEVTSPEPMPLDRVFQVAGRVRDLVTLAANDSCELEELVVRHPSVKMAHPLAKKLKGIGIYAQMAGSERKPSKRLPWEMLFSYEQIGGAAGVAKWLTIAEDLQAVLGSLMSVRYAERIYTENRLQNVALAAETYHRIRFSNEALPSDEHRELVARILGAVAPGDHDWLAARLTYSNEPNLRRRLVELSDFAGDPFRDFVGDARRWSHVITTVRNGLTHFQGKEPDFEGVYYLAESVYVLLLVCLLREAGVSEDLLASVPENRHINWLKEHVRQAVATQGRISP
jgi:hypothetical protein